jgi:large conductance mechanosensitive channel
MLKEFRDFIMRGNVIDLAVAVLIAGAFGAVVTALTTDIITPIIAAFGGVPDFSAISFTINGSQFLIGHFINTVLSFLITAIVVFFFIVKPMNVAVARSKRGQEPLPAATKKCPECLSEIPIDARRCAFCTAILEVAPA